MSRGGENSREGGSRDGTRRGYVDSHGMMPETGFCRGSRTLWSSKVTGLWGQEGQVGRNVLLLLGHHHFSPFGHFPLRENIKYRKELKGKNPKVTVMEHFFSLPLFLS